MRISDLVLANDHHIIALNKPAGMPVQQDRTGDPSLHRLAQAYCKRDLFLVNRLDRPCSGLVIMAKTQGDAALLSSQWRDRSISKKYIAVIPKGIEPSSGELSHRIDKRGARSIALKPVPGEEAATLAYRTIGNMDNYSVLQIDANTGFFHQIRAQFAAIGFPIKGDDKYGAKRGNKDRSVNLHAFALTFVHPGSSEEVTIECPLPANDIWPQCTDVINNIPDTENPQYV